MKIYTARFVKVEPDRKNHHFLRQNPQVEKELREAKNLIISLPTSMQLPMYKEFFDNFKDEGIILSEARADIKLGLMLEIDNQGRRLDLESEVNSVNYPMKIDLLKVLIANTSKVFIAIITDDELEHFEKNRPLRRRFRLYKTKI